MDLECDVQNVNNYSIRHTIFNNEDYYIGIDIARCLGYSDP